MAGNSLDAATLTIIGFILGALVAVLLVVLFCWFCYNRSKDTEYYPVEQEERVVRTQVHLDSDTDLELGHSTESDIKYDMVLLAATICRSRSNFIWREESLDGIGSRNSKYYFVVDHSDGLLRPVKIMMTIQSRPSECTLPLRRYFRACVFHLRCIE